MRIHFRFIHFISILLVLLSIVVVANDDEYLVEDINIPPMEDVVGEDALDMYLNPTEELTNRMTKWANSCTETAINLNTAAELLVLKREASKIAAFGTDDQ